MRLLGLIFCYLSWFLCWFKLLDPLFLLILRGYVIETYLNLFRLLSLFCLIKPLLNKWRLFLVQVHTLWEWKFDTFFLNRFTIGLLRQYMRLVFHDSIHFNYLNFLFQINSGALSKLLRCLNISKLHEQINQAILRFSKSFSWQQNL